MTGYGKAEAVLDSGKLTIEVKTLNGKNSDANIKTSLLPKDKELQVRQMIAESLVRGTIDFFITWEPSSGAARKVNPDLVKEYFTQMKDIRNDLTGYRSADSGDQARMDNELLSGIMRFQDVFDSFIRDFIEAQCKLFQYEWKASHPQIHCFVGYLPFYPRSTEEMCFYVSYQDEERVFSGAVHEINHMIFFQKWKEMHGSQCAEPVWPDPLWYLEEIIVDPTLNDERVKHHTLYENKAYPLFYEKDKLTGVSIMDRIMDCYNKHSRIEDFLDTSYKIVREYFITAD